MIARIHRRRLLLTVVLLFVGIAVAGIAIAQSEQTAPLPTRTIGASATDYPAGEACASSLAIDVSPFGSVCSAYCEYEEQCPEGWGCATSREPTGAIVKFCRPRRILPTP